MPEKTLGRSLVEVSAMVAEGLCSIQTSICWKWGACTSAPSVSGTGGSNAPCRQMGDLVQNALIFDLDGVIADTARHHYRSWQRLAEHLGVSFNEDSNDLLLGRSREDALSIFLSETGLQSAPQDEDLPDRQELLRWKNGYFLRSIAELGEDDLKPGVRRILAAAREEEVPVGLASSSRNARTVCERLGILGEFAAFADGNSGLRPKPEPDLFLWVAGALGRLPHECTVIEDAPAGVEAAVRGGLRTVAVGDAAAPGSADLHLEDLSVASLGLLLDGEPSMAANHE